MTDTLTVADVPGEPLTIEPGDVLLIFPDVGASYHVRVERVEDDRAHGRITDPPERFSYPDHLQDRSKTLTADELADAYANGDLLKNPEPSEPQAEPAHDGGRYGPYEDAHARREIRNTRAAEARARRRL